MLSKRLTTAVLAVATLSTTACASGPYDSGHGYSGGQYSSGCYNGERGDDCRERLRYEQQSQHHYVWRNDHYESQDATGAAVAGGIIGFILGVAIAGSPSDRDYYNAHRNDNDWRNRCGASYSGFDYHSGTYLGQDGYRHYCTR
ncbi:MAG: hypothetical protein ACHP84_10690 [Caulobacterales bacterium]